MFEEGTRLKALHGAENVFDFSLGNPILEPPQEVHIELLNLLNNPQSGMHRYMPNAGFPETCEYVAGIMRRETGYLFESEDVVMCVGAGGGLNVVFKALLEPGDEVLTLAPFFVEYAAYARNHGGLLTTASTNSEFQPDLSSVEEKMNEKTKIVLINSPNNPTAVSYTHLTLPTICSV